MSPIVKNIFFGLNYCTWTINQLKFSEFKKESLFDEKISMLLFEAYLNAKRSKVPNDYSTGLAYSTRNYIIHNMPEFEKFNDLIHDEFLEALDYLKVDDKTLSIERSWANRMHKGSSGVIHNHVSFDANNQLIGTSKYVLIVYYTIPKDSADLIFLNPLKYLRTPEFEKDRIKEQKFNSEDMLLIKPTEGFCVLHDGRIPHTVSKHNSYKPRDVLIFDYISTDQWQSG